VARVYEPGGEAAPHTIDDGAPGSPRRRFERQQVDIEDLVGHGGNATAPFTPTRSVREQFQRRSVRERSRIPAPVAL
jgi:hypothetical protein